MSVLLGCIADDFTGATDLAGVLAKEGMRVVQTIGVPGAFRPDDVDAIVVALKTRTCPAEEAVTQSTEALDWLRAAGAVQYYFKYCSTFDSTANGNIGPVAQALMDALGTDFTVACPAFPVNGRTVYKGHLFVGDVPLAESGMRDHPLTPMTDSNLVRVLGRQTRRRVGLVEYRTVRRGAADVRSAFDALRADRVSMAVLDAVDDADLRVLGEACRDLPLVTGGSGLAIGLPANLRASGRLRARADVRGFPAFSGRRAVIAGSCSSATQAQVAAMAARHPAWRVDPRALAAGQPVVSQALAWAAPLLGDGPVLIYATANAAEVRAAQAELGVGRAGTLVEEALSGIAAGLVDRGVDQLIVAGGETAGAVVKALGVEALQIGPEIDPGVPWTATAGSAHPVALALKSGNFGTADFFLKAWSRL
jgi:3-dehydrotetronate 4-kinase